MGKPSVAGCIIMCYKAASPVTCIAFVILFLFLCWIKLLQDSYSSFRNLFQTNCHLLFSINAQVKVTTSADSTLKTCTSEYAKNESLSREDLKLLMQKMGIYLDPIKDGTLQENITTREISTSFDENEPSLEEVKEAFDLFDENGDGYIDARELRKIVSNLGFEEASEDECQRMIKTFDDDGDGRINLGEFVNVVKESFSS